MESVLIVSATEKAVTYFSQMVTSLGCQQWKSSPNCAHARRMLSLHDFDFVIINAPLPDGSGVTLSRLVVSKPTCQAVLVVKAEQFDHILSKVQKDGVFVLAKPLVHEIAMHTFRMAITAQKRIDQLWMDNKKLKQQINDIRVINRAKYILISNFRMSEKDAHRYIEKQAMDMRLPKTAVAQGILKTYEY